MSTDLLRCALPVGSGPPVDARRATHPFVLNAAEEALLAARQSPQRAGGVLAKWFRSNRRLGSRDRRLVAEMVYDTLRHEGILTRAGHDTDAARLREWLALHQGQRFETLPHETPHADYATALSLPHALAETWLSLLGDAEAAALGAALAQRAPTTIRANRARCTREQLAHRLAAAGIETEPTQQAPNGLHVLTRTNFPALDSFRQGWFEVQDEASQLFCDAISVEPGQTVMDLCAGAGGKGLALAARGARVFAHDIRPHALQELHRRATRAGVHIEIGAPRSADVVIVDAPCSGTGRLRRDPALRLGLPMLALPPLIETQHSLIAQGAQLVRPGGMLVYATCSLLPVEHHHTLPGWRRVDEQVLWPHRGGTDGFSWCCWRRDIPLSSPG